MKKADRDTSREELVAEVERLRSSQHNEHELRALLHELQVHQEEINAQNAQLMEAQRALEDSRDRYVDLYDFAPIGYVTLDRNGMMEEINLSGAAMIGKERAMLLGLPLGAFVHPKHKERFYGHLLRCRDRTGVITVEVILKSTTIERDVQLVSKRRGSEGTGRPVFLTAMIDLTERNRLEDERRRAEEARERASRAQAIERAKSEAKDRFLATLSHELRTPLTPVVAALTDPTVLTDTPGRLRTMLEMIRRNIDLEVQLIDDLLDVTRIARERLTLKREPVDAHAAIREVVQMSNHQIRLRDQRIEMNLRATHAWTLGDPTRLRQVFWNLLSNATKFTGPQGLLRIASENTPEGDVELTVSDTGVGMDQRMISELFLPSDVGAPRPIPSAAGLGLGLVICEGVVRAHGGSIRAQSEGPGLGSTFTVSLPTVPIEEIAMHPDAAITPPSDTNRAIRILLVEDHPDSAEILSQLLKTRGYHVQVAATVVDAIELAKGGCDLLISDIRLPDGSGLDLMRHISSQQPVRGIALSGFGTEQDERRSKDAGYQIHVTKPVNFTKLLEIIAQVAEEPEPMKS